MNIYIPSILLLIASRGVLDMEQIFTRDGTTFPTELHLLDCLIIPLMHLCVSVLEQDKGCTPWPEGVP